MTSGMTEAAELGGPGHGHALMPDLAGTGERSELPGHIIKFQAPEMVFGAGSLAEAGFAARRLGARSRSSSPTPGCWRRPGSTKCSLTCSWPA